LTATLSDGSAPAYVDTSLGDTIDTSHGKEAYYAITYKANSPGQTLTVTWTNTTAGGNVTIQSVALGTSGSGSITGALTIPAAGSNISLTSQGTTDWAVWGYSGSTSLIPVDRKTTGGSKISTLTAMGSGNNAYFNPHFLFHGLMGCRQHPPSMIKMEYMSLESIKDIHSPSRRALPHRQSMSMSASIKRARGN
jgi:hypothetical protein